MMSFHAYCAQIEKRFEDALSKCMDAFSTGSEFHEPDFTAGIVLNLPRILNRSGVLPGFRFGGCFIHQSPYITYQYYGKSKCELGDLLILCRDSSLGRERFNAVLLQLKMADRKDIDQAQWRVYARWPPFDFGNVLTDRPHYDIYPKTITQGALYAFVHPKDNASNCNLRFTVAAPSKKVYVNNVDIRDGESLARFLSGFVTWTNGRTISDERHQRDDSWSHLIWELVTFLNGKTFRRRNIRMHNGNTVDGRFERRNGTFFDALLDEPPIEEWEGFLPRQDDVLQGSVYKRGFGMLLIDKKSVPTQCEF